MKSFVNQEKMCHVYSLLTVWMWINLGQNKAVGMLRMITASRALIANKGESVVLECQFYADQFNLFDYPVLWKKTQKDEEHQINTMGNINDPFLGQDRFEAKFSATPPRYNLQLSILNIREEDIANYTCELRGPESKILNNVTHYVHVRSAIISVSILDGYESPRLTGVSRRTLRLIEGQERFIQCLCVGGFPPPQVHLTLGGRGITSLFLSSSRLEVSGEPGMRLLQPRTLLSTHRFLTSSEDDGMTLTCMASVHGQRPLVDTVLLAVEYAPKITCHSKSAEVGEVDVPLTCFISANPALSQIFWVVDENGTRVSESDANHSYRTTVTPKGKGVVKVDLYIREVHEEHFRSFTVVAENQISVTSRDTHLIIKPEDGPMFQIFGSLPQQTPRRDTDLQRKKDPISTDYYTSTASSLHASSTVYLNYKSFIQFYFTVLASVACKLLLNLNCSNVILL